MDSTTNWQQKANIAYLITLASYLGLIILQPVAQLAGDDFSFKKLAIQWLPLLLFVPGMITKTHYRTYSWLCFVILLYFTAYVVEIGSPFMQWTDIVGVCLSVILFISAMFTSRYMQRWLYESQKSDIAE